MYVVFYGNDRTGVRNNASSYINKNLPEGATLTTIEGKSYEPGQITDALGATSLFGGVEWFVLDTPSDNSDCNEEVKGALKEMAESINTFVILEGALLAPAKKSYSKYAADTSESKQDAIERLNVFGAAEALAAKDRRSLWLAIADLRREGVPPEELIGILWWQLKSLRLAKQTSSAAEAGMKDFPYNKAKRALAKFTDGEVERLSQSLLELYHDGHAGVKEIDLALEEWCLKI
tara:strand:+ start:35884 stop:36585 length:702 start_codon:yes stop_codon:yes gene_type:complete